MRRTDERAKSYFRSNRFFSSNGQWYFATREATNAGPYATKPAAEAALVDYLAQVAGIFGPDPWSIPGARN